MFFVSKGDEEMTETQFLVTLAQTKGAYRWKTEGKTIVGVAKNGKTRGEKFNPMTAVCRSTGMGTYSATKTGTKRAASKLGASVTLAYNVTEAAQAKSNRGNTQVLRGKIKQVLGL